MKQRTQSQTENRGRIRGFNTKGYFVMVEPYCQQYLKAKHATYEKSRRLREAKNEGKENSPLMFEFNKPKSGFYQLKGCSISKLDPVKDSKEPQEMKRTKPEYLAFFLKKYKERKEKKEQRERIGLPLVTFAQPSTQMGGQSAHCKSIGLGGYQRTQSLRVNTRKLRTEPLIQHRNNKSCHLLEKTGKGRWPH